MMVECACCFEVFPIAASIKEKTLYGQFDLCINCATTSLVYKFELLSLGKEMGNEELPLNKTCGIGTARKSKQVDRVRKTFIKKRN